LVTEDNPFATRPARRLPRRKLLRGIVLLGLALAGVVGLQYASRLWLVRQLTTDLERHPPRIQQERLAMLAQLGSRGVAPLVGLLAADQQELASAAFDQLRQLNARREPSATAMGTREQLVSALAQTATQLPDERQPWAALLLDQLLVDLEADAETADSPVANAARRLRAQLKNDPTTVAAAASDAAASDAAASDAAAAGPEPASSAGRPLAVTENSFGLPRQLRPLPIRLDEADSRESGTAWPALGFPPAQSPAETSPPAAELPSENGRPGSDDAIQNSEQPFRTSPGSAMEPTDPPELVRPPAHVIVTSLAADAGSAISDNPFAAYVTREVIGLVGSVRPSFRRAAIAELQRRGFSRGDLEMAERLASSNARVRLELIEELKRRGDVDAVQWLLWLAADTERDVRLEAVAVLGTMNDRRISPTLHRLMREERDAVVAGRIERVLGIAR
jgi:hypothetical protein